MRVGFFFPARELQLGKEKMTDGCGIKKSPTDLPVGLYRCGFHLFFIFSFFLPFQSGGIPLRQMLGEYALSLIRSGRTVLFGVCLLFYLLST
jgi:hypothetical protein